MSLSLHGTHFQCSFGLSAPLRHRMSHRHARSPEDQLAREQTEPGRAMVPPSAHSIVMSANAGHSSCSPAIAAAAWPPWSLSRQAGPTKFVIRAHAHEQTDTPAVRTEKRQTESQPPRVQERNV
jgi:hypothetical protein